MTAELIQSEVVIYALQDRQNQNLVQRRDRSNHWVRLDHDHGAPGGGRFAFN